MGKGIDIDDKLAKLAEEFKKKLPSRIDELKQVWQNVLEEPSESSLDFFHLKAHSLQGTAKTYGYQELGKKAGDLEKIIKSILGHPELIQKNKEPINQILNELSNLIIEKEKPPVQKIEEKPAISAKNVIYLLDDIQNWEQNLASEINKFGYKATRFTDVDQFLDQTKAVPPAVLIININKLDNILEQALLKLNNTLPIIFLATSGEFELRLKAVRLGGEGFFIKPYVVEELINQIDSLIKLENEANRILIVDDDIDVAQYNATLLNQANMKTCIITRSDEIDRVLHEFNPELILIDLNMPDCNGLELAKIIRQQSMYESVPIVYLSVEEDKLKQLHAMSSGADDFIIKSSNPDYLLLTVKNKIDRYKKLQSLMVRDSLTGLYNHSFILKQLDVELKESMLFHNPLSIALIDLDRFRNINDTYGHQAGDHVLRSLGLMLPKRLHENDIIGRFEGEKFLVILPNTTKEAAKTLIDDLRKQFVSVNYTWDQQIFNASFSAGIASFPDHYTSAELIEAAQESLEKSKKTGRNRVEVAN